VLTTKFYFSTYGLDEYESDSIDFIRALLTLSKLTIVRLCVLCFEEALAYFKDENARPNDCMLRLLDLTQDDAVI
jgi:hypothetical protein